MSRRGTPPHFPSWCGGEIDPGESAGIRFRWRKDGQRRRWFCSQDCRNRFNGEPYGPQIPPAFSHLQGAQRAAMERTERTMMDCTEACRARVECVRCRRTKAPRGRDVAPAMANGMCDQDCPGYAEKPMAGHLWPDEELEKETAR